MLLKITTGEASAPPSGWSGGDFQTAGTDIIANLTDRDTSSPSNVSLSVITPFTGSAAVDTLVDQAHHGWEREIWYRFNFISTGDPLPVLRLAGSGLTPGASYLIKAAGVWSTSARSFVYTVNGVSEPYNNTDQTAPVTPAPPAEITAVATDDGSGNGVLTLTGDFGPSSDRVYLDAFTVQDVATTGPTITDINTNNEVTPGTTATLTGTNLTGATGFNIGSEAQTDFTVVSDTSITFTTVRGGNPYNQDLTGTLLHPDGNQTITVQQVPESGTFAVTAASPNTTDDASLWTGLVDTATSDPITIVDGDQAWVKNPNNLTNLAIQPDGTITADETGTFVVQIWLASEGVWGSDQTVTFEEETVDPPVDPPEGIQGLMRAMKAGIKSNLKRPLRGLK